MLEYQWYGPSSRDATTLVFLHGGVGCAAAWGNYPQRLSDATGLGALVYSRAGYGMSEPATLPRSTAFMHQEALTSLPSVLETHKIRDAILIGHSDGGSIALIYAGSGKSSIHIRGLILEAPHVFVEDLTIQSIRHSLEEYRKGDLKQSLAKYHRDPDHTFLEWSDVWLSDRFRSWNIEEYVRNVHVPVLVIQGEQDNFGTIRQVEAIQRLSTNRVETLILPDCGHRPHRRQPEQTLEASVKFIRSLEGCAP